TNYRAPSLMGSAAPSRGLLVSDFLVSDKLPEDYLKDIKNSGKEYNGFNLVVGDMNQLWWYSNKSTDIVKIEPGIHVISNHLMDTPWPKTLKTRNGIQEIYRQNTHVNPEDIFQILSDKNQPPDNELPDTGVGLEWERLLSSIFVSSDIYGTRSSAIILAEPSGRMTIVERTFSPQENTPAADGTRQFNIKVPK
nr:NRDE family protein [Desulfobacteraceae bacterium]